MNLHMPITELRFHSVIFAPTIMPIHMLPPRLFLPDSDSQGQELRGDLAHQPELLETSIVRMIDRDRLA